MIAASAADWNGLPRHVHRVHRGSLLRESHDTFKLGCERSDTLLPERMVDCNYKDRRAPPSFLLIARVCSSRSKSDSKS